MATPSTPLSTDGQAAAAPSATPAVTTNFLKTLSNERLGALTSTQKGFVTTIRMLEGNENLTGLQLKRTIADMFPPASLFSKEMCDVPAVHSELRDFLDSRGANLQQHSSHRIIMTLAHSLYEEPEDTQVALEIAQAIIAAGRRVRTDLTRQSQVSHAPAALTASASGVHHGTHTDKLAHNVAMRLKEKDKKFSGDLGESWMEFVDDYLQMCRDYSLTAVHKLQYMHNLLRGDAKRFYLDKIDGYATGFQQAVTMIEGEYNSAVRQTRVKNLLNSLRVSTYVATGVEVSAALAKVYKVVVQMSRQAPQSHRGDAHKIEFLRNAVVGFTWASEPLSRVATYNLTFQQLYSELEAAVQLDKEATVALLRDKAESHGKLTTDNNLSGILYNGQGRYARNPTSLSYRKPTGITTNSVRFPNVSTGGSSSGGKSFDPLSILGCFNCGGNHLLKDCERSLNTAKAAARKMEYYAKKAESKPHAVHQVLADICQQLDGDHEKQSEEIIVEDDRLIFESLLPGWTEGDDDEHTGGRNSQDDEESLQVFMNRQSLTLPEGKSFHGACIDSAAQKTVIGREQAEAYCTFANIPFAPNTGADCRAYSFGTHKHRSLGRIVVRVPVAESHFMALEVDVVDVNVPFLLGLDVMLAYKMVLDTDQGILSSNLQGWEVPLASKLGHLYYEWEAQILFTESELHRVHKHFYHPDSERLYSVMRRADPEKTSPQVLRDLERIDATCDLCQRQAKAPHRFRVSLPEGDIVFNRTVCIDIMSLESKRVLHIVDKDTKFSAAAFLKNETADEAWNVYMRIWVSAYVGFSDNVATDQGPQFESARWKSLLLMAGIKQKPSGIESHNAIGVGERYHSFLRHIYTKVRSEHPDIPTDYALTLANKAMNDSAGPNGLVPTLLVFGIMPRIPIVPTQLPEQIQRMKAMKSARSEMTKVMAKSKIARALRAKVPAAASSDITIGSEVLVYREKPVDKWLGPFKVLDVDGKAIHLDVDGTSKQFSTDKVKTYLHSMQPAPANPTDAQLPANPTGNKASSGDDIIDELKGIVDRAKDNELEAALGLSGDAREDRDDALSQLDNISAREFASVVEVNLTEIIDPNDPRVNSPQFKQAKTEEVSGLERRETWRVVRKNDVSPRANILGGRFVLTMKNLGTNEEKAKARYVAQGNRDKEKARMVHNITTLRQSSTRIIVSVAAVKGFRIFAHDVHQAYLQSDDKLTRQLFLLPKKKDLETFGLAEEDILELLRPIYGTTDAGDYWGVTVDRHAKDDLGLKPLRGDPSLYIKGNEQDVDGLMGVYVDDGCLAGNDKMQRLTEKTLKKFDSKPREWDNFEFFGTQVKTTKPGTFTISQERYAKNLKLIPSDASFEQFRSHRAMFAWLAHTRPDMCCAINKAAQVTPKSFGLEKLNDMNRAILDVKRTSNVCLSYGKLDIESLHVRVYTDASFAGNDDLSSQLGFIVLLCDKHNCAHILDFSSKKSKRVVRSILGGEVYAFADGFDRAFMLRHDLQTIYRKKIPLHILIDSLQMFDVITKASSTTERRLMIDIAAARESYNREEISNVGLVLSENNIADGFTKPKPNKALEKLLTTGIDDNPIQQWIIRTKTSPSNGDGGM